MDALFREIYERGLVPVIRIDDIETAVPLAGALLEGGLPVAEITFRTDLALESMKRVREAYPNVLLGAGTVLTPEQVGAAAEAGARFIVTPGFNPRVVERCLELSVPVIPGCSSPSDMEKALEAGLRVVKFFPAEQSGGLPFLKAVSAPYRELSFIPTGGISGKNVTEYLSFPKVLACGGSWMVKPELVSARQFGELRALIRQTVLGVMGFSLLHLGINASDQEEAAGVARLLALAFGFDAAADTPTSIYAGSSFEIKKSPGRGRNGHIGIETLSVDRARRYLLDNGFAFADGTERRLPDGRLSFVYLDGEFGGFAAHLQLKQ